MLDRFLEQVRADAFDWANDPEDGGLRLSALLTMVLERLEEAGVIDDGQVAYYCRESTNLNAEVHGYSYDSDDDRLALYFLVDAYESCSLGDSWTSQAVGKDAIDRAFRRLSGFVKLVQSGKVDNLEESQPVAELMELIRDTSKNQQIVELHVITLGTVSDRAAMFDAARDGLRREVWDLVRLIRTCGGGAEERIAINFVDEFGEPLPCLVTPKANDGIQVLLTCIPGRVLADIYGTYRSRILERNVRSFLQFTGKINKGIRDTILNSPQRFLPYNNGLSATAASVAIEELDGGLARIKSVQDFQIVNGGQTTASIASCLRRDKADLDPVLVPMKLSIVPAEQVDALVPLISKFANTQNRIQEADFSANHPWHIGLEKLSRDTWTKPSSDAPRGTRWFYERSRGQYADELSAQNTPAGRRRFRAENPTRQKITKPDLAKYVLSWDQRPHVVSRGGQKCFMEFMNQLTREGRTQADAIEFKRIIGQAILFHAAERLYGELGYQGYRANVVAYAIAKLSHLLQRRMPWGEIWTEQAIPDELVPAIKTILIGTREIVVNPPPNRIVSEWSKKEECWSAVLSLPIDIGIKGAGEQTTTYPLGTDRPVPTPAENIIVEAVKAIPADVWFAVSKWAKETESLQAWQRSLAYSLGKLLARALVPSPKQAIQGVRLLMDARRLGFGHERLTPDMLERLQASQKVA